VARRLANLEKKGVSSDRKRVVVITQGSDHTIVATQNETAVAAPPPVGIAKPEPLAAYLDRELQSAMSASLLPDADIEQPTAGTVDKARDAIAERKAADAPAPLPPTPGMPPEPTQENAQEAAKQDAAPAPVAAKPEPAKPAEPAPAVPETPPAKAEAPQSQNTKSREQKPEGESVADEKPVEPKDATAPTSSGAGPDPFSVDAIEAECHPEEKHEQIKGLVKAGYRTLMVGDTTHDLQLARNAGTASVGVSFGAHAPEAFADLGPLHVAHSTADLTDWLLAHG
jgi:site-specific DNA-cytosine methylase